MTPPTTEPVEGGEPFVARPDHSPFQLWEQAERESNGSEAMRVAIYNVYMRQAGHIIDLDQGLKS